MKLAGIALVTLLLAQLLLSAGPVRADTIHIVRPGETLSSIARMYGVSVQAIINANGLSNPNLIYVGQRLRIPGGGPPAGGSGCVVYTVKRGDTLAAIAWRYGVTVSAIVPSLALVDCM